MRPADQPPLTATRSATRRTKLVCTLVPATAERVPKLLDAGMDVARINFAHGTAKTRGVMAAAVHDAARSSGRPIALLTDLAGPKLRLGEVAGGSVRLHTGDRFVLGPAADRRPGDARRASVSYERLATDVRAGDPIFLADGAVELRVTRSTEAVETEVVRGGTLRSHAGVSIPSARMSTPALTRKDRADAARTRELGASYVGQSFVRGAEDVAELRRLLGASGPAIVAKIETRPAVEAFDDILEVADAVMIARGDLGVELPYEEVPLLQKQLVRRALDRGVPSIVATQMLESMTAAPRPTRAEASDVANAVFDGADAIMLSAETAIGGFPIEAAEAAVRIARHCEEDGGRYLAAGSAAPTEADDHSVVGAAALLARTEPDVAAICCYTRTGRTARLLAALRPRVPIIAFSPVDEVVARLALVNAVVPRRAPALGPDRTGPMLRLLRESQLVAEGASVVVVGSTASPGSPPNQVGVHRVAAG